MDWRCVGFCLVATVKLWCVEEMAQLGGYWEPSTAAAYQ